MKLTRRKQVIFISLVVLFFFTPFLRLQAQISPIPPSCSNEEILQWADVADEYNRVMVKACEGMNNSKFDSTRYFLEKAIFFKSWSKPAKSKLQQLKDYLGMQSFRKLVCFCDNAAALNAAANSPSKVPDSIKSPEPIAEKSETNDSLIAPVAPMYETEPTDIELDEATKNDMQQKALVKCRQFGDYNKTITNPNSNQDLINNAIESSVALFVNEDSKVEVSNKKSEEAKTYTVRKYLLKLSALNSFYDKIEISGSRYYIVNGLRKGPDGNYYGLVSYEQIFTGYKDNKIAYSDITKKNIIVMVRKISKMEEGSMKTVWDVLLKDVQIVETL
ncbi:MAG: hypothetical protein ABIT08_10355 [Bacteroidia bacterium]